MCGLEFPDLETNVWQRYRDRGVVVVGLDPGGLFGGDDAVRLTAFAEQTGVTFPIGWDVDGSYYQFLSGDSLSPFPLDVVVDRDGRVVHVSREYDPDSLTTAIESLLE